jgi:hypothetical protein
MKKWVRSAAERHEGGVTDVMGAVMVVIVVVSYIY